jgi:hypothetical protein
MTTALALVRLLPTALAGRLAIAFVEIAVALTILSGAVIVGHDLAEWRTWWAGVDHPWAPTPAPTIVPVAEPRSP